MRLYRTKEKDKITDKVTEKVDWDTNERSKAYTIDTLSRDLEDGKVLPHSAETYSELRTFVRGERGKMAASQGNKDDCVMAISPANIGTRQQYSGEILFL